MSRSKTASLRQVIEAWLTEANFAAAVILAPSMVQRKALLKILLYPQTNPYRRQKSSANTQKQTAGKEKHTEYTLRHKAGLSVCIQARWS